MLDVPDPANYATVKSPDECNGMLTYSRVAQGDLASLQAAVARDRRRLMELLRDPESGACASPLCIAAEAGQLDVLEWLLQQPEVSVDHGGEIGGGTYSPLIVAVEYGHVQAARRLLQAGADVNAPRDGNWFPIYIAVEHRQPDCLNALLEHSGVDYRRRGYHGTARELAIRMGELAMAERLAETEARAGMGRHSKA